MNSGSGKRPKRKPHPLTAILSTSTVFDSLIAAARKQLHTQLHRVEILARRFPARITLVVFLGLIALVTALLRLPIATSSGTSAPFIDALFSATSAVCVTGLTTVDMATYWSSFGEAVLAAAMFTGGLGIMSLAALLALAVSRHLGLTQRLLARDATRTSGLGDVGQILSGVFVTSVTVISVISVVLFVRFLNLGMPGPEAAWNALFMAISSFNNTGFVNIEGGAALFIGDWVFIISIILAATVGALGFPVVVDIAQNPRKPRRWSLHTKLTLTVFPALVLLSIISTALLEWNNPATFGALSVSDKVLNSLLTGINPRSLGISAVDVSQMHESTTFLTSISMFIGGGSASTAGGIKVTTLAVLLLAVVSEARGYEDIEAFRRRMPSGMIRLAVSVLVIGAALVGGSTFLLLIITDFGTNEVVFETISAFATVGLSMGITAALPTSAKFVLVALMFSGRLGPMTLAAALALKEDPKLIRMPEAQPIVG